MTNDNWTLIQELFHQASELQGSELDRFVEDLDQHPDQVRQEVTSLLRQDQRQQQHDTDLKQYISSISRGLSAPDIEGYDIIELIAHGGMGSVYRAFDPRLSRTVAIKVLHPYLSQQQKFKDRFMREARAAARIQHENINTVFEIAESNGGLIHIASAYCEGVNLSDRIRQGGLTIETILSFMAQLVSALVAAHTQGIIHRDLKPENIIINAENRLILVDFGIAKIRDELQTSTGEIIGTPAYMSPEQFRGEAIDPLADIWALGMILYEMMEGKTPYDGMSPPEIVYTMLHEPIPYSSDKRKTYRPIYDIMQQCLNVNKGLRPANAEAVQQLLAKAQAQVESDDLYQQTPEYTYSNIAKSHQSRPSIATHKNIFILYLFCPHESVSLHNAEKTRSLVRKYKGQLLSYNDQLSTSPAILTATFGYPLADEMTLKNGLLCGLAWIQQHSSKGDSFKVLAHYQQVDDSSNVTQQSGPQIEPMSEITRNFIMDQNKAGVWVSAAVLDVLPEALVEPVPATEVEQQSGCFPVHIRKGKTQHPFTIKLSPFTGRHSQLSLLNESWEQAREGDFQRVLISGEAGIGKSRLIYEFRQAVVTEPTALIIELACSPYEQSSTYYPVLSYLKQQLTGGSKLSEKIKLDKKRISDFLHELIVPEPIDTLLMCQLMGITLDARETSKLPGGDLLNRRYQSLIGRILTARPSGYTTLLIIEDLHWIDQATSLVVEQLLQPSSTQATLIVLSCRPEYKPVWLSNVVTSNLYLSKLRHAQSESLLKQLINTQVYASESTASLDQKNLAELADRTGGNPLFIEELAKSVQRNTSIADSIPGSIQDTLTARLERLGSAKELAQIASVIGRNFKLSLLQKCSKSDPTDFQQQFNTLVQAEIFYPSADSNHWYFKHALIRDAAYQTLNEESKQHLHFNIASTIEDTDQNLTQTQPSLLALHWEKSLNYSQAVYYWQKSAQRNLTLFAISECIEQCQYALSLCDHLEEDKEAQQLVLYTILGPALMNRYGYADDRAGEAYANALKLGKKLQSDASNINILFGNWTYHCVRAEHSTAFELSQEMIRISEASKNRNEICESYMVQGINDFYRGEFLDARLTLQTAIDFYDPDASTHHIVTYGQDPFVATSNFQSWNELALGNTDKAIAHAVAAICHARKTNHPMTLAYALSFATYVYMSIQDFDEAEKLVTESIALCTEQEIILFLGLSLILRALLNFTKNEVLAGEKAMTRASEVYLPTGAQVMIPNFLVVQAEVLFNAGRIDEAEELIDQALAILDQTRENWCLAPAEAIKTMICMQQNRNDQAQIFMQKLMETLKYQQAAGIRMMLEQKGFQFPE